MSEREEPRYILGVDFGSTTLSVKIYDQNADLIAASTVKVRNYIKINFSEWV